MDAIRLKQIQGTIKTFNELVPIGSIVTRINDFGKPIVTKTRTVAWALGDGHIVVSCEGQYGTAICLKRIIVHPIQVPVESEPGEHRLYTEYEGEPDA